MSIRKPPSNWLRDGGGVRPAALWVLLIGSSAVFAVTGILYVSKARTNAAIDRLRAGTEMPVDAASAPPALLDARAAFLLKRNRIEEAQPFLDQAAVRADDATQVRMLYNMANARMRAATLAIEKGNFDKAIPLVTLAKSEYRNALRHNPGYWDAKYNLDIAMRLVRDLPQGAGEDDEKPLETPEKLWTDLPGVPKGLP
jgi:mxaK protein